MKPLKYALLGIAGLVAVVAAAMALIAANFDANKFKADIAGLVQQRTQRTLVIDGAINLAFFPKIGVELGRLSLSERRGSAVFAAVNSARISVELLPLLSKQIVVDRIAVDGLRANLQRHKDGSSNFDDLLDGSSAPREKQGTAAPALRLEIAGVDLSNTDLQWRDEANNRQYAIKGLKFKTGRLGGAAPSKFELALGLAARQPALDVQIKASGGLVLDAAAGHYRLADLAVAVTGSAGGYALNKLELQGAADFTPEATAIEALLVKFSGRHGNDDVDATLGIPKARVAKQALSAEKISLALKLTQPEGNLGVTLSLPSLEATGTAFKSADLTLALEGKQGENSFKGSLASPLGGNLEAKRFQLPKLSGNLNLSGPKLPKGALALSLAGGAALDLARNTAQLDLAARSDQSNIHAKLALTQFSPPTLGFDLGIDQLNLDTYLGPKPAQQAQGAPERPIDLSALKAVNASGNVRIGALQAAGVKATDISARVKLANGRLEMSPHAARLYQGSLAGALSVDANGNRFEFKESLSGVSIGPLLKDVADKDVLEGRGNLAFDLRSSGGSLSALKKALDGNARIDLKDGAIKGINLAATMRSAKSALGAKSATEQGANKQEKTDFSELAASFTIKNGVAHNEDLMLKSPFLRLSGNGDINIGGDAIDYLAKATVVSTAGGQGGKDLAELKGLTVPVRLYGPYDALKYRIDFNAMAGEVAKEKARDALRNAIGEKFGAGTGAAKPEGQKTDQKDQARELLKGLFGR